MSPTPIADPEGVDERRAAIGLDSLAEAIARHRAGSTDEPKPADFAKRRAEREAWARKTGWR
jgi:hypothetical protein